MGRKSSGRQASRVTLFSLLVAVVGLLLVIQYLATRQILEWHRQRVELVARLVLADTGVRFGDGAGCQPPGE